MEPDELLQRLKSLGKDVSRPTLPRWVRQELIPAPEVRSLGRGRGARSIYPAAALGEAYAAAVLLRDKGLTVREVVYVRETLYKMAADTKNEYLQLDEAERRHLGAVIDFIDSHPAASWPLLVAKVNGGWPLDRPAEVYAWDLDEEGCIGWHLQEANEDKFVSWW